MAWRANNAADALTFASNLGVSMPFSASVWGRMIAPGDALDHILFAISDDTANDVGYRSLLRSAGSARTAIKAGATAASATTTTTSASDGHWHHVFNLWTSNTSRSVWMDADGLGTSATNLSPTGLVTARIGSRYDGTNLIENVGHEVAFLGIWSGDQSAHRFALASGVPPWKVAPEALLACLPLTGPEDYLRSPWTVLNAGGALTSGCFVPNGPPKVLDWLRRNRASEAA